MNSPQLVVSIIAAIITLLGLGINVVFTIQSQRQEEQKRRDQQKQWQESFLQEEQKQRDQQKQWRDSFRAELQRDLKQESTLEVIRRRLSLYPDVWKPLKITAHHVWDQLEDKTEAVQQLANQLTDVAYSETGLVMTDRSRRLLLELRRYCGSFIDGNLKDDGVKIKNTAHQLKHSLRSDLFIEDEVYESILNEVARGLPMVDDF